MDRALKHEIMSTIQSAMRSIAEETEERWVSGQELCRQIQCFTPSWLKEHGHELPRTSAAYSNRKVYPLHKINRLMNEGKIKSLDVEPININ